MEDKDLFILHGQYYGCWSRSKVISNHGLDLVILEYSSFSTRRVQDKSGYTSEILWKNISNICLFLTNTLKLTVSWTLWTRSSDKSFFFLKSRTYLFWMSRNLSLALSHKVLAPLANCSRCSRVTLKRWKGKSPQLTTEYNMLIKILSKWNSMPFTAFWI